ncbi:uncharacterized protein J8A68_001443 [[Candida] subhashii]|uniref:Uncharacterized protein n=1 Tax=[Candida] subhashii TaxID=561895 RepID=A0A8J5R3I9_9ASCO|nr:uncharacterized protein J8A68_001443 [[Candida] subhashii]KAG7665035.1 hypothetical protein J8A68_001443 [[Candida] subhashii]
MLRTFRFKTPALRLIIIYPYGLDHNDDKLKKFAANNKTTVQYHKSYSNPLTPEIMNQTYISHNLTLYNSLSPANKFCEEIEDNAQFQISQYQRLSDDFVEIIKVLIDQLENDEPFRGLWGFFQGTLDNYTDEESLRKQFYKFAGTSVWLEEYGVHLMVSRVSFSYTGIKWDPQISLLYVQVYDKNWTELHDVDLIIPIKNPSNLQREYKKFTFPRFMPIPFYYNSNLKTKRWHGPEDARLFLMKNEYNETEPALLFNAYHRKPVKSSISGDDKSANTKFEMYRSMFIGYLFQFQLGKTNTDGTIDERFDHIQYNKVVELRIKSRERRKIEKNWTPIIDPRDTENINLIYECENLTILKCPLKTVYKGEIICDISFNQSRLFGKIGKIRGGTELIPIINQNDTRKQSWIGFLRSHIKSCGCGNSMYRPNIIVLTRILDSYKITHLSSSVSFDIPVTGSKNSSIVCDKKGPNALMPNGISMWEIDPKTGVDYLTLSLSVADENNNVLHITGINSLLDDIQRKSEGTEYFEDEETHQSMLRCGKLASYIDEDFLQKYFFKFAGTSVWLQEYGVHLMVSRVLFSYTGIKWNPQISSLYAQGYDKNWDELHDIDLISPIKNPSNLLREYISELT